MHDKNWRELQSDGRLEKKVFSNCIESQDFVEMQLAGRRRSLRMMEKEEKKRV